MKLWDWVVWNQRLKKISIWLITYATIDFFGQNKKRTSKNFIFLCVFINDITKETLENNDIDVIINGVNTLWLNEKHIEEQLGHKKLLAMISKYNKTTK